MNRIAGGMMEALRFHLGTMVDSLMRDPMSAFYFEVPLDGCAGLNDDLVDAAALPAREPIAP